MESLLILAFVGVLLVVFSRAAGNPLDWPRKFRQRRFANWMPLGLTYAFLYMGRYNLTVAKNAFGARMSKKDFGLIFGAGTITYAHSFLANGPLTDRIGGKRAIIIAAFGSAIANAVLGTITYMTLTDPSLSLNLTVTFAVVYSLNMYFQSFGAVAIVKVNSNWFHVRERGSFGGMFGVLISLGIYFAFDWGKAIVQATLVEVPDKVELGVFQSLLRSLIAPQEGPCDQTWWVFFVPTVVLGTLGVIDLFVLRERPGLAGLEDFDTGDASSGDNEDLGVRQILKRILTNRVIWIIGLIEFCSGVLRNGVMHWFPIYVKETGVPRSMLFRKHWGKVLCVAGISGGMTAGFISDKVFGSRRGPVAALLYLVLLISALVSTLLLSHKFALGSVMSVMSLAVIGVHGMLSGTATMDFGGRKAAGTAVGVIDGFVYLGTGLQSLCLGWLTSKSWTYWPIFMVPFAVIGLVLSMKIWAAFPNRGATASK